MSLQLLRKGLLRLPGLAARPARGITSKPPREHVGPVESVIALTTFFLAFTIPSGWFLANMESYKGRE